MSPHGRNKHTLLMYCIVQYYFHILQQSTYLKDILENMCHRKLRETTDFEWRRSVRCYLQPDPSLGKLCISICNIKLKKREKKG